MFHSNDVKSIIDNALGLKGMSMIREEQCENNMYISIALNCTRI